MSSKTSSKRSMLRSPKGSISISSWIIMPPTKPPRSGRGSPGGRTITSTSRRLRASWINQVERWFAELTRKRLRRGIHTSVRQLEADIRSLIDRHNQNPRPFKWTKSADEILASVKGFCSQSAADIMPRTLQDSGCSWPDVITLNPVLVIISLAFWFWMWGIPGERLPMPMLAITKIICDRLQPLAVFGHFLEG